MSKNTGEPRKPSCNGFWRYRAGLARMLAGAERQRLLFLLLNKINFPLTSATPAFVANVLSNAYSVKNIYGSCREKIDGVTGNGIIGLRKQKPLSGLCSAPAARD